MTCGHAIRRNASRRRRFLASCLSVRQSGYSPSCDIVGDDLCGPGVRVVAHSSTAEGVVGVVVRSGAALPYSRPCQQEQQAKPHCAIAHDNSTELRSINSTEAESTVFFRQGTFVHTVGDGGKGGKCLENGVDNGLLQQMYCLIYYRSCVLVLFRVLPACASGTDRETQVLILHQGRFLVILKTVSHQRSRMFSSSVASKDTSG